MKRRNGAFAASACTLLGTLGFCCLGNAAEPPLTGMKGADLKKWEDSLRQAGASPDDVAGFMTMARGLPPSWAAELIPYFNSAPSSYFYNYFMSMRRRAQEETKEIVPKSAYADAKPSRSCESLTEVALPDAKIEGASIDPKDGSCRVTVVVTHPPANDQVRVFVALPVKGWNGRFRGTGGGGYTGGNVQFLREPVSKGYAAGATDAGNKVGDGSFALDANGRLNWQGIRDNAYLGIHDMTIVGKALVQVFYGKAPRYSYFVGSSNGGRQAVMEAERFSSDYDGILALYPSLHRDRTASALWPQVLMLEAGDFIPKAKLDTATAAAVAACGDEDGTIDDPVHCTYDPRALVGAKISGDEFSQRDAEVIRRIWDGPRRRDGSFLWYGPPRGTDLYTLAGTLGTPPVPNPSAEVLDWYRYFLFQNPAWDWKTLNRSAFELAVTQSTEEYGAVFGTDNPDLSAFRDRGGKLLMVHGLADAIPAQGSIDYYDQVQKKIGSVQETMAFVRLFLVPGGDHGFMFPKPAPSTAALIDAIIHWVEDNKPPDSILSQVQDDHLAIVRTRQLFAYTPHDTQ